MSIPVDLDRLESALADYGIGYLLTASAEGDVKAVTVEPQWVAGTLTTASSRGTSVNLARNPKATLIFPPLAPKGFTLIVDGTGTATEDGITVTPASAVLHRPASHSEAPSAPHGCGHDCAPL